MTVYGMKSAAVPTAVKRGLAIAACCLMVLPVAAQRQIVGVIGMPPVRFGALAAGDYDRDGDDDVFLTGELDNGEVHAALYRYVERRVTPIPNSNPKIDAIYQRVDFPKRDLKGGSVVWRDLNNDGALDILVTGLAVEEATTTTVIYRPATDIYINGGGTFFINGSSGLPGVHRSRADAADFNGDGLMDVVLGGESDDGLVMGVWLGNGSGGFSPGPTTFEPLALTSLDISDMDSDGDMDFIVGGFTESGKPAVRLFRNDGNAQFSRIEGGFPELYFPSTAFGDIDFDNDADIIIAGGQLAPTILRGESYVFRNNAGSFDGSRSGLTGLFGGGSIFRDMDGDTDLDFVTWGQTDLSDPESQRLQVFENIDLSFLQIADLRGVLFGSLDWFDSDGNGRLDILITGDQEGSLVSTLYEF
ncbi:MAG: FG-GAP repeat domain-containing protein [Rhodothermales bacterium]